MKTEEDKEILKIMGFHKIELAGQYRHKSMDGVFDIEYVPMDDIFNVIYKRAERSGMEIVKKQIRTIIGLE